MREGVEKMQALFARDNEDAFLTVEEVLDILASEIDCTLLAGKSGLNRRCRHLIVWETPDGLEWLQGEEFLLTSGYALKDRFDELAELVRRAKEKNVSAIAVKEGRHLPSFPAEMLEEAERCGLPIIRMSHDAVYTNVTANFYAVLFNKRSSALIRARNIDNRLLSLIFDYHETDETIVALSSLFGISIAVYDAAYLEMASCYIAMSRHEEAMERFCEQMKAQQASIVDESDAAMPEAHTDTQRNDFVQTKIRTEYGEYYAWRLPLADTLLAQCMCVISTTPFDSILLDAVEHGRMVLSLKFGFDEKRVLHELKMRRTATELLLNSQELNRDFIRSMESDFSGNGHKRFTGVVVTPLERLDEVGSDAFKQYLFSVIDRLCKGEFLITEREKCTFVFSNFARREEIERFAEMLRMYAANFCGASCSLAIGVSRTYHSLKDMMHSTCSPRPLRIAARAIALRFAMRSAAYRALKPSAAQSPSTRRATAVRTRLCSVLRTARPVRPSCLVNVENDNF